MQPSLEKLRKFFGLEHENQYPNTAIIGGLAKMLDYWEGEARADGIAEEVIQAVAARLRSYEKLSPGMEGLSRLKAVEAHGWGRPPEAGQKPKAQTQPQTANQPPRPAGEAPQQKPAKSPRPQQQPPQRQNPPPHQNQQKQRPAPPSRS